MLVWLGLLAFGLLFAALGSYGLARRTWVDGATITEVAILRLANVEPSSKGKWLQLYDRIHLLAMLIVGLSAAALAVLGLVIPK